MSTSEGYSVVCDWLELAWEESQPLLTGLKEADFGPPATQAKPIEYECDLEALQLIQLIDVFMNDVSV